MKYLYLKLCEEVSTVFWLINSTDVHRNSLISPFLKFGFKLQRSVQTPNKHINNSKPRILHGSLACVHLQLHTCLGLHRNDHTMVKTIFSNWRVSAYFVPLSSSVSLPHDSTCKPHMINIPDNVGQPTASTTHKNGATASEISRWSLT